MRRAKKNTFLSPSNWLLVSKYLFKPKETKLHSITDIISKQCDDKLRVIPDCFIVICFRSTSFCHILSSYSSSGLKSGSLPTITIAVKAVRSRQLIFLGSDICFYGNFFVPKYKRMTENVIMFLLSTEFSCLHFYRWLTKKEAAQRYKDILKSASLKICCIVCGNIFNEE